ncbi:MAG: hypothetical protein SFW63_08195 [Alphaproteobacteria bacterium]|nr:hypothetical protein [Alphaproteobacteria bacterium]
MSKLTKTEQIIAEKTVCILLVRGENPEGGKIYAYVAIRADKLEAFMEAQKQGTFYPEDYGIIVESGEGEPSDEVKQKMTKEYGFNHQAMIDIASPEKAHDISSNISSFVTKPEEK